MKTLQTLAVLDKVLVGAHALVLESSVDIQVFSVNKCADIVDKANISGRVTEESSVSACRKHAQSMETCGLLGEMLALAQMRDDFNKSSFCETMSSAHACSAAMEDFLSSDAVADLAFGHCLRSHRLTQAKTDTSADNYCQRFQGVLRAAVKASDSVDTLRECYMMELEQKSRKTSTTRAATKAQQIPPAQLQVQQPIPATQAQVQQQIPAAQLQVQQQMPVTQEGAKSQVQQPSPATQLQVQQQIPATQGGAKSQIPAAQLQAQQQIPATQVQQQIPAAELQVHQQIPATQEGAKSQAQQQTPATQIQVQQHIPVLQGVKRQAQQMQSAAQVQAKTKAVGAVWRGNLSTEIAAQAASAMAVQEKECAKTSSTMAERMIELEEMQKAAREQRKQRLAKMKAADAMQGSQPRLGACSSPTQALAVREEELREVFAELSAHWGRCVGLYVHGSTIFFNKEPKDLDLLAIVDDAKQRIVSGSKEAQFIIGRCEVSVYEREFWLKRLEAMDLTMLTCVSTPKHFVPMEIDDDRVRSLRIPFDVLEESLASYAEYTWVKAHRKMDGFKDRYAAGKNCYFAFRILSFGCQLIDHGWIPDLTAANGKYEVMQMVFDAFAVQPGEWDLVEALFGHLFRAELEHFTRKVAMARNGEEVTEALQQPESTWLCALCGETARPLCWSQVCCATARDGALRHRTLPGLRRLKLFQTSTAGAKYRCELSAKGVVDNGVQMANCEHRFHQHCIVKAIRRTVRSKKGGALCPVCSAKLRVNVNKQRAFGLWATRPTETEGL
ncbi:unnamed protein product [Symbiodinium natans]|uniref:RING-type domain-containing protein n=1 Tax=Symbiodinium natans TaxID=878477 RepID=A0A812MER3_9DINO|nr:unnamed protein product [Symbiodinium natans]